MNALHNVAVYLARSMSGVRPEEIDPVFWVGKYRSVRSIVTRAKKQLVQSKQLRKRIDAIGLKLNKSQAMTGPFVTQGTIT